MKSKAIFMALLAFAFGAQAVPVSNEQVTSLVRAWASSKATMGEKFASSTVRLTKEHRTPGGVKFYTVHLADGGVALTSADTEIEPIIAFTSASAIEESDQNPLWVLINRDIEVRHAALELTKSPVKMAAATAAGVSATALTTSVMKMATAAERKWAAFLADGPVVPRPTSSASPAPTAAAPNRKDSMKISDVYVSPMVKTKWAQGAARNQPCYNRFTPKNYVCGCTATATAQLMRFFAFPTGKVPAGKVMCEVDDIDTALDYGGYAYQWNLMPNVPESVAYNAAAWDEIGHLTRDAGVLLKSSYTAGAGSAYVQDIPDVLKFYGYRNAVCYYDYATESGALGPGGDGRVHGDTGLHNTTTRRNVILSNLDAGLPVVLGIQGYPLGHVGDDHRRSGHAIVADGYGFVNVDGEQTEYIHLNMGWAGSDDAWYNTPEIMTDKTGAHAADSGFDFTVLSAAAYNVFTNATGEVLSGRVTYEDGTPAAGIIVSAGGKETVTGAGGTYGLILPANGSYDVSARSTDGTYEGEAKGIILGKSSYNDYFGTAETGNSWGHRIILNERVFENSVQIVRTQEKFGALDAALDAAQSGDTVEILSQTVLRFPQAITNDVTIRTVAGADLEEVFVICRDRACNGFTNVTAKLSLENVKFRNTKGCFVHVHSNAFLSVSGTIGLSDGSYVHTEDEKGIQLAGELESYLTVDCLVAKGRDQQFGTCSDEAFAASASHFLNPYDEDLGGEVLEGKLIWARVPVDPSIAIAYFTGVAGDSKQYYRKLTTLFEDHAGEKGDVVILKDCELKASASVTSSMRLVCTNETGAATVTYAPDTNALISVEAEASLSVSNVVLSGATYRGAILVRGGGLTLESDTVITNCVNNFHDDSLDDLYAGAGGVTVSFDDSWNPGHATVMPGVLITMCQTEHGAGGGIFVEGDISPLPGCSLDLQGGTIELCKSSLNGGGVCAQTGTEVLISGDVRIRSNVSEQTTDTSKEIWDNLFVADASVLTLDGALTAGETIGLRCAGTIAEFGGVAGEPFGLIADGLGVDASVTNSATLFRSDDLPNVWHGAVGKDKGGNAILVWDDSELPEVVPVPEDVAVRVIYEYGGLGVVTNLYDMLDKALASIHEKKFDGPVTVELCADHDELVMSNGVNLVSSVIVRTEDNAYGKAVKVIRAEKRDTTISVSYGADLLLTNVWLYGGCTATVAVRGGALTMESGAVISDMSTIVTNLWSREHSGVSVGEGGVFTMRDGAEIACCTNLFESSDGSQLGPAGGVAVEGIGAVFNLEGGWIHGCAAGFGGGVFINNDAKLFVSGNPRILDNYLLSDPGVRGGPVTNANLSVACESFNEGADKKAGNLILTGEFTGAIGVLEPRLYRPDEQVNVDTNVFGRVDRDAGAPTNFVDSASLFHRDAAPSVTGLVVTNADPSAEALLVWSTAVKDGVYTDKQGNVYLLAGEPTPRPVPPPQPQWDVITNKPSPIAFRSIDRISDTEWTLVITNREPYCNYRLIWTTDLTKGFTETGKWEKASGTVDPVWTTNVITTGGAWFWRAEGTEGTNMVPHQVEGK